MIKPDSRMSWVVMVACGYNVAVSLGVGMSCGVYVAAIIDYYGSSRAEGYVIGSLSFGLTFAAGPLVSVCVEKTSHRVAAMFGGLLSSIGVILSANAPSFYFLYFTFGLTGIGCCFLYTSSLTAIAFYFKKYRAIAIGLATAGGGTGVLLYPIICLALIDAYSWKPSMYIVAGICLNACVGSALIRPCQMDKEDDPEKSNAEDVSNNSDNQDGTKDAKYAIKNNDRECREERLDMLNEDETVGTLHTRQSDERLKIPDVEIVVDMRRWSLTADDEMKLSKRRNGWRSWSFLLLNVNSILYIIAGVVLFVLIADMYSEMGIPHKTQNILFMSLGICNIVGKLSSGIAINMNIASATQISCILNFIWGVGLVLFCFSDNFIVLLIANILFGLFYGGFVGIRALICLDIVGLQDLNVAFGIVGLCEGISSVVSPPLLGLIYDATQSYTWLILVAASVSVVGAIAIVPPAFLWRNRTQTKQ